MIAQLADALKEACEWAIAEPSNRPETPELIAHVETRLHQETVGSTAPVNENETVRIAGNPDPTPPSEPETEPQRPPLVSSPPTRGGKPNLDATADEVSVRAEVHVDALFQSLAA
jgi:hypothetical protein